jgi:hypothetical protein
VSDREYFIEFFMVGLQVMLFRIYELGENMHSEHVTLYLWP